MRSVHFIAFFGLLPASSLPSPFHPHQVLQKIALPKEINFVINTLLNVERTQRSGKGRWFKGVAATLLPKVENFATV